MFWVAILILEDSPLPADQVGFKPSIEAVHNLDNVRLALDSVGSWNLNMLAPEFEDQEGGALQVELTQSGDCLGLVFVIAERVNAVQVAIVGVNLHKVSYFVLLLTLPK